MNKRNISDFNFLTNMKNKLDNQKRETLDKIKAQVKAGVTANIGQSLHGDFKKSGGDNKSFDTSKSMKEGAFGTFDGSPGRKDY